MIIFVQSNHFPTMTCALPSPDPTTKIWKAGSVRQRFETIELRPRVAPGTGVNIAGGSSTTVRNVLDLVGDVVGLPVVTDWQAAQPGDVHATGGETKRAAELLRWVPAVLLPDGSAAQVEWD